MLVRFSFHQINAPGSYWYLSQSFVTEKEACGYAKVIQKKEKKEYWKNGQVSKISKTMGTQMPTWKEIKERDE